MDQTDYKSNGKQSLTLAQLMAQAERATLPFRVAGLGDGKFEARVTRPSLTLMMQQHKIPHTYRDVVSEQIKKFGTKGMQDVDDATTENMLDEIAKKHGVDIITMMPDLIDATCIAGWVKPRLVLTPAEEDLEADVLCIERIPVEDREAFYEWCNQTTEADEVAVKSPAGNEPTPLTPRNAPDGEGVRMPADRHLDDMGPVSRGDTSRSEYRSEYVGDLVHEQDARNQEAGEEERSRVEPGSPARYE
jgi:hypothetical protein